MEAAEIEALFLRQHEVGQKINTLLVNFKKDSTSRKTTEYLQKRLTALQSLWEEFATNHDRLIPLHESNADHPYFKGTYYEEVESRYQTLKDLLSKWQQPINDETKVAKTSNTTMETHLNTSASLHYGLDDKSQEPDDDGTAQKLIFKQRVTMKTVTHLLQDIETHIIVDQPRAYYDFKISMLRQYQAELSNNHQIIFEYSSGVELDGYKADYYYELELWIQTTIITLQERLANLERTNQIVTTPINTIQQQLHLPKITLPTFSGDYIQWIQFKELYLQLIHEQPIPETQKMFYLVSNLSGEARNLIKHLTVSNGNYQTAWNILYKRYENKRLLVTALLNKLLSQTACIQDSSQSIKKLHDTTKECLLGLQNLGLTIQSWDPILVHLLIKKFDRTTHTLYEQSLTDPRELNSLEKVLEFLETRFQSLEALGNSSASNNKTGYHHNNVNRSSTLAATTTNKDTCVMCNQIHPLFACRIFISKSPSERLQLLKKHKLCINCMRPGHTADACKSRACTKCPKKHNTLVHPELGAKGTIQASQTNSVQGSSACQESTALSALSVENSAKYVLLSTIMVRVTASTGKEVECRAILDSGSQLNFVTENLAKKLALQRTTDSLRIQGIGSNTQRAQHRANVTIRSRINGFTDKLEVYILPKIIEQQPAKVLDVTSWALPRNLQLADPQFHHPGPIDLLIGAENYYQLLTIGQIKLGKNLPTLQNSVFGWIIGGKVASVKRSSDAVCGICTEEEVAKLDEKMERFWRLEEADEVNTKLTAVERKCEEHFNQTIQRMECGRFMVRLPFLKDPSTLGESRQIAFNRFRSLERKLKANPDLKTQYTEFMNEYLQLGHMEEVHHNQLTTPHYFLPHHCVLKPDSTTSKLRVVFDASAKTSTNISLNNTLHTGPRIQEDLFSILLRFRLPRFVFTADIEKMYRQVLLHPEDRQYQLILWRQDESLPIKYYRLTTVTYGITTAPYLAIRCLHKLASQVKERYPLASASLTRDFYVDDVLSGSNTLQEALDTQAQLIKVLQSAGFNLRKWCSNHPALLQTVTAENRAMQLNFEEDNDCHTKTLGLRWDPRVDEFQITTTQPATHSKITKRTMLSEIAHLFDPLGILSPVIIVAKIFIQQLWSIKLDWDAAVPMELHTRWTQFRQGLQSLSDINFPRHVFNNQVVRNMQLHAFSDASEKAYGAAIYIRSTLSDGRVIVRLLCAKSKVAPLKTVSLARLELCAAKVAAQLAHRVKRDLNWQHQCFFWTDSEIVLAWINSTSSSYHTFVANRIAAIQEVSTADQWQYVSSKDNPADLVSRGLAPQKLQACSLWFYGPLFLHGPASSWPVKMIELDADLEKKQPKISLMTASMSSGVLQNINHRNSFKYLQRVIAYILRFSRNCRPRKFHHQQYGVLAVDELEDALTVIIKATQEEGFPEDLRSLKKHGQVSNTSSLVTLSPFLDNKNIIRVGGRLTEANISYDSKHPMLLPYGHEITRLIMTHTHFTNAHAGPQALLALVRQRFWAIKAKITARSVVQRCIRCSKTKPQLLSQFMGDLPARRVQPARPFVNTGVDFCGPFWTHFKIRGKRPIKTYVAIFCCFSTKAVHIEVVSDLTTDAFIGALKRFIGRRGHCRHIHCDNATNFIGAKNKLSELQETIYSEQSKTQITEYCTSRNIDFHLIPPRAPHFGGLWEAAVKSAKYLFQRSVAAASLTYEELETLMIEIEAILNSRPLTPMSADPNDLTALTPGHFLVGEPLTSIVDPFAEPVKGGLLRRWKLVSQLKNEFWQRWTREYLSELQHRYKWNKPQDNVDPGTMVIIKEDNVPSLSWPLGRIIQVFKGKDDMVRVADVKTANGVLRRPIHKLAPLPIAQDNTRTENLDDGYSEQETSSVQAHPTSLTTTIASSDDGGPSERKKRRRTSSGVGMFLLTCLVLPVLGNTHITLEPFTSPPGLHFEKLGLTHLITNEWNLVVLFNLRTYWSELRFIINTTSTLQQICQTIKENQSCNNTISQFTMVIDEIRNNNELLQPHPTRFKRAPLNIVGNIASSLFGVLDSSYAEKMSDIVADLEGNQQHLLQLLQNQTSIIDSTANIIKASEVTTETRLNELHTYIKQVTNTINLIQQELREQRTVEVFNGLALRLILSISNYQRMQAALLDVVIDSHHGKVNPLLISPKQMQSQLTLIKENLPSNIRLPTARNNLLELYNLLTIEGRITDSNIVIRLKLPLLSHDNFEMLSIVPVPFLMNGTFLIIEPTTKYLIVDLHRELYSPLSTQELSRCSTIEHSVHLCRQYHPLYRRSSQPSSCELDVLTQSVITTSCKISGIKDIQRWTPLVNPNHWIYVVQQETPISIICDNTISQQSLQGSGILTISKGCMLKDERTTIHSHNLRTSEFNTSFVPSRNFTALLHPSKLTELVYNTHFTPSVANDIAALHEKINNIRKEETLPTGINHHQIHHLSVGYSSLMIILLLSTYLGWRRYKDRQLHRTSQRPIPTPRRQLSTEQLDYRLDP